MSLLEELIPFDMESEVTSLVQVRTNLGKCRNTGQNYRQKTIFEREEIERSSPYHLVPKVYEPNQCGSQSYVAPTVNEKKQLATRHEDST